MFVANAANALHKEQTQRERGLGDASAKANVGLMRPALRVRGPYDLRTETREQGI